MDTFEICKCGMLDECKDEHSKKYKHDFEPISKLTREKKDEKHIYTLDVKNFPYIEEDGNCSFFQCGKSLLYHQNGIAINHEYKGEKIVKRKINVSLPKDSSCYCCSNRIDTHFYRHHIHVKFLFPNRMKNDEITIMFKDHKNSANTNKNLKISTSL